MGIISELLSNNGYIMYNKKLAKNLGIYEAIYLGELCAEYSYWKQCGKLEDDMFFSTQENIMNNTQLSVHQQKTTLKKLKDLNIITVVKKGLPAKNYYKINEDVLQHYMETDLSESNTDSQVSDTGNNEVHSESKINSLENQKLTDINNNKQIRINNNTISKDIVQNPVHTKTNTNKTLSKINSKSLFSTNVTNIDESTLDKYNFILEKSINKEKLSRYEKCYLEIFKFTDNEDLRVLLDTYLQMRLEIKDKPIYYNQWKGLLGKLNKLSLDIKEQIDIVQYSLDRGYASFFELKQYKPNSSIHLDSEYVRHNRNVNDEEQDKRETLVREERVRNGEQVEF